LIHAQRAGEPCAWIQPTNGHLFPPDLAAWGVDLQSLIVLHIPAAAGSSALPRAAEILLRSGAFGLVVIDLLSGAPRGDPSAWQSRLAALAREHGSTVILLSSSESHRGSLGPLVTLRVAPERRRTVAARYALDTRVLKNKAGAPLDPAAHECRAPYGLE
jgi:recombination protein RecA